LVIALTVINAGFSTLAGITSENQCFSVLILKNLIFSDF